MQSCTHASLPGESSTSWPWTRGISSDDDATKHSRTKNFIRATEETFSLGKKMVHIKTEVIYEVDMVMVPCITIYKTRKDIKTPEFTCISKSNTIAHCMIQLAAAIL